MKKILLNAIFLVVALLHIELTFASDDQYVGPDFSAKKVTVDGDDKTVSQIHMSSAGFREVAMTNVPFEIMYIGNYKQDKVWMVVPSKQIYSEMMSLPDDDQSDSAPSTLFDSEPCKGFGETKMLSTKSIGNQKIEEWGCINEQSEQAVLQWFDTDMEMVIREEDKGAGASDVLVSDIKFQNQSASLFELPDGYKKVSMNEIVRMMSDH